MKRVNIEIDPLSYEVEEELKTLRTNIQFCGDDKKVIMLTSSVPGEGKTNTAINLAITLAELQKKVILIDADLRKSVMIARLKTGKVEKGLSHFLSGQCALADVVLATNIPRFHIMFAGPVTPNPTELLSGERFERMLESFRDIYDYVIIDAAPLGLVVDAAIIAKQCDGSILVIESEAIKYRLAQDVKNKLESSGCPILGAVLNKVDRRSGGRYYGKYYGKYYGHYYGHEDEADHEEEYNGSL